MKYAHLTLGLGLLAATALLRLLLPPLALNLPFNDTNRQRILAQETGLPAGSGLVGLIFLAWHFYRSIHRKGETR